MTNVQTKLKRYRLHLAGALALLVVFGLVPWSSGKIADELTSDSKEALSVCTPAYDDARRAYRLYSLQGFFPGFGDDGRSGRDQVFVSVTNAVRRCIIDDSPPPSIRDGMLSFYRDHVEAIYASEDPYTPWEVENTLHELGMNRELIELGGHRPGDGQQRASAYLHLGDLQGAAELWRAPGVTYSPSYGFSRTVASPAWVFCLAGDYAASAEKFREMVELPKFERPLSRTRLLSAWAECTLRSGSSQALEEILIQSRPRFARFYRARQAAQSGDIEPALALLETTPAPPADGQYFFGSLVYAEASLHLWLLVQSGQIAEAVERAERSSLGLALNVYMLHDSIGTDGNSRLYSGSFFPMVDHRLLREVASSLEDVLSTGDVDTEREVGASSFNSYGSPDEVPDDAELLGTRVHQLIAKIYHRLAIDNGVRWDDEAVARDLLAAREHWPNWDAPAQLERDLAELHGGFLQGDAPRDIERVSLTEHLLNTSNPDPYDDYLAQVWLIAHDPDMTKQEIVHQLGQQIRPSETGAHFLRLTMQVSVADFLGEDTTQLREQLDAFRGMIADQPNPLLFQDIMNEF